MQIPLEDVERQTVSQPSRTARQEFMMLRSLSGRLTIAVNTAT